MQAESTGAGLVVGLPMLFSTCETSSNSLPQYGSATCLMLLYAMPKLISLLACWVLSSWRKNRAAW